ncbi:class I histocompatibility antigen, F10 alpha chain-like [Heteronotia binoei]|uniref:class I histocompatibility antigen, F10 alpha chain-like n=1 Tax=Heteronotia binoei TaxID=13085 RepID=UPI00292F9AC9|nr:class I histocompatibility antigen, F10 alpha chain-like [Heteronotia binoei]
MWMDGLGVGLLAVAPPFALYEAKGQQGDGYTTAAASNVNLILCIIAVILLTAATVMEAWLIFYMTKGQQEDGYTTAAGSSSAHSLRYFYTALSEDGQGLSVFSQVGYVDDQPITRYDSSIRRSLPVAPWMEKVEDYESGYWERTSRTLRNTGAVFRKSLEILQARYNQSHGGLHTLQWMSGCEVGPDGRLSRGLYQYAYDGEDFIALDRETLTWTAHVPQAQETKRKWEAETYWAQRFNGYLEEECMESLQKYLDYGREALQRREAPVWRVTRKKGHDGQETLFCQLYGFYPKGIEVAWMKDGEDQKQETFSGGVVPNSDGTYHTWLSIEVDPKERDRYRCRVGHDSLPEPLDLAWKEPASNERLILGIIIVVLLAAATVMRVGFIFYMTSYLELILGIIIVVLLAAATVMRARLIFYMRKWQQCDGYTAAEAAKSNPFMKEATKGLTPPPSV